jgi:hypothetical protein
VLARLCVALLRVWLRQSRLWVAPSCIRQTLSHRPALPQTPYLHLHFHLTLPLHSHSRTFPPRPPHHHKPLPRCAKVLLHQHHCNTEHPTSTRTHHTDTTIPEPQHDLVTATMQRYTVTIINDTGGGRPSILIPFQPSSLVTAFKDEIVKRAIKQNIPVTAKTHTLTLRLQSQTGPTIDPNDVLSDVVLGSRPSSRYSHSATPQSETRPSRCKLVIPLQKNQLQPSEPLPLSSSRVMLSMFVSLHQLPQSKSVAHCPHSPSRSTQHSSSCTSKSLDTLDFPPTLKRTLPSMSAIARLPANSRITIPHLQPPLSYMVNLSWRISW